MQYLTPGKNRKFPSLFRDHNDIWSNLQLTGKYYPQKTKKKKNKKKKTNSLNIFIWILNN